MKGSESIINFMYFANNFSSDMLENCFEVCNNSLHLKNKYKSLSKENRTGTEMFFKWFMLLDSYNQKSVASYINENYKN